MIQIDSSEKYRMGAPGARHPFKTPPSKTLDGFTKSWTHVRPEIIKLLQKRNIDFHTVFNPPSKFT